MADNRFSIARLPRIEFGGGAIDLLPSLIPGYGSRMLLVTGRHSFCAGPAWPPLRDALQKAGIRWEQVRVDDEPSPQLVDEKVAAHGEQEWDVVVAIGGGSALDAGKAIAGLLRVRHSVMDYLEGVGPELPYEGPAVPYIAVPTTAGTGSEATKNAVLSVRGRGGFKKSFRDEQLVAQYAVVDPDLLAGCPKRIIAANGMDAVTQLVESYVSARSNPLTDALCLDGLRAARAGLPRLYQSAGADAGAREKMAYASLLSGICLAQTGLGSVHGLASPLGALFPVPHGEACGTLLHAATAVNIEAMQRREPENPALEKYARLGSLLGGSQHPDPVPAREALLGKLEEWTREFRLRRLSHYGIGEPDLDAIVAGSRGSSMKTNPVVLTDGEIRSILEARL